MVNLPYNLFVGYLCFKYLIRVAEKNGTKWNVFPIKK